MRERWRKESNEDVVGGKEMALGAMFIKEGQRRLGGCNFPPSHPRRSCGRLFNLLLDFRGGNVRKIGGNK